MPVGLYVNNTAIDSNDASLKNVLSQIYTSSSPSCSSVSSSSTVDSRLDSRPVVFVVLTQNELNNLNTSKLNLQLNELQFVEQQHVINKENSVSQIDDDEQINYLFNDQLSSKNNIDYAIDAVLAKCRQDEPSVDTIPNVNSEMKIGKKICKKSETDECQQSKSTKARTSYISSLIANREKNADEKPIEKTKSLLASKTHAKSNQVLIQPKPVIKPNNQPDFVLNKNASNLSQLLSGELNSKPLDYDKLEQSLCESDRVQLKLVELKSRPVKKSKPKRRADEPAESVHHTVDESSRPKKLKTIADIVKHQASNQHKPAYANQHSLIDMQQQQTQENSCSESELNNQDLTITWINQNQLINNIQYSSESEQLNMDNLLELELNTDQSSPIDKFIDLDEIDVNPLDYRSSAQMVCNQMDEFNLQFSVCSSGSSGFSEPSNFSCSSSISSGSASNLGYTNCSTNVLSVNSINNLFSPDDSSPYQSYEHNSPYQNSYNVANGQHLIANQSLDWSMIDLADKHGPNSTSTVNCGENMFANFNFFNDEIKLEI